MIYDVYQVFYVFLLRFGAFCYVLTGKASIVENKFPLTLNHFMVLADSVAFNNYFRSWVFDTILLSNIYLHVVIIIHAYLKMLFTRILDISLIFLTL